MGDLQKMYRTAIGENFPEKLSLVVGDIKELQEQGKLDESTISFSKLNWNVDGTKYGVRYGTNPHQPCALYRRDKTPVETICNMEFLKMGKNGPSITNLQDIDRGCHILKYFNERPAVSIHKHINPCGFAVKKKDELLEDMFERAYLQDLRSAYGSVVNFNTKVTVKTAEKIMAVDEGKKTKRYVEAVSAPDYEPGCLEVFNLRKDIRIVKLTGTEKLYKFVGDDTYDIFNIWAASDGSLALEKPFLTKIRGPGDLKSASHVDEKKKIKAESEIPLNEKNAGECVDAWHILANIRSNGILFYKNGGIVAVGTGEQERIGAVEQAVDKAHKKLEERLIELGEKDPKEVVLSTHGNLKDSILASDGFFPNRDNIDAIAKLGIAAIVQPGGSVNDHAVIKACNEYGIAMVFTEERSFAHF